MLEIEEIKKILPHKYPFLMIDRVLSVEDEQIIGLKNVTINEWFFQGHFPNEPVFPGVLQIEALAQLAAIKVIYERNLVGKQNNVYLIGMTDIRFRKKVVPGDALTLIVEAKQNTASRLKVHGKAMVGDEITSSATISAVIETQD